MYAMSGIETQEFIDGYIEAVAWANVAFEDDVTGLCTSRLTAQ